MSDLNIGSFLSRYPALCNSLFEDCDRDIGKMETVLEPLRHAESRCQAAPYYVQAITTGQTTFLTTNLSATRQEIKVSSAASNWVIGRSSSCAISIQKSTISRCHAVIGHIQGRQFYLMDMGSSNGTRLNRRRLTQMERYPIHDGDLLEFGPIQIEFFIAQASYPQPVVADHDGDITMF
jgi:hypothetical protein